MAVCGGNWTPGVVHQPKTATALAGQTVTILNRAPTPEARRGMPALSSMYPSCEHISDLQPTPLLQAAHTTITALSCMYPSCEHMSDC